MKLAWTARAAANLEEIAGDNTQAAARVTQHILSSVARLEVHPHLGKPGRIPGTRELVIARTAYIAAYRLSGTRIDILAVRHGARTWLTNL